MTEDDEVLVCAHGEGWMANAKEQQGYVKVFVCCYVLMSPVWSNFSFILGVY